MNLHEILSKRIMVLDGAMGTMIQRYKLAEADYRGERFKDLQHDQRGNNELLCLTQPHIIREIHEAYLEAGADIIETNTFNANQISIADYHLEELVYEFNVEATRIAREAADKYTAMNPDKPRFVAGAIGPTSKIASLSPNVNDPGYRSVTFDDLVTTYTEQIRGLIDGGAHLLLVETVVDTLNCKAALFAINQYFDQIGKRLPIMVSGTITDNSGRTLSGQTTEAFYHSISHAGLFSVGLNCALGAKQMRPYVEALSVNATCYVSSHPNAGLPNEFGEYDESPEAMAYQIKDFAESGFDKYCRWLLCVPHLIISVLLQKL